MIYLNDHLDDFDFNAALPLLSEQRRQQALRFRHELGRKQCAAAYLLLCEGLQQEYGISERPLFDYGEHGKPVIVGHPDIHFNLSQKKNLIIVINVVKKINVKNALNEMYYISLKKVK